MDDEAGLEMGSTLLAQQNDVSTASMYIHRQYFVLKEGTSSNKQSELLFSIKLKANANTVKQIHF